MRVVRQLRDEGMDVVSVLEKKAGMSDDAVITVAKNEERIVLTFDKDFGEKVFKEKRQVEGVILLRFSPESEEAVLRKIQAVLHDFQRELKGNFLTVTPNRVKIRSIQ
jgi:predicted nuclease of predicted toxin-antitoxin system